MEIERKCIMLPQAVLRNWNNGSKQSSHAWRKDRVNLAK